MKLATFNINGIKARIDALPRWLEIARPDVVALQEIKSVDEAFPRALFEDLGYRVETHGQKGFNGVAILSRLPLEDVTRGLPGDDSDEQARVIAATLDTPDGPLRLVNCYFVNGQEPGSEKFAYKLQWLAALQRWIAEEMQAHPRLVLVGDFNVAPEDRDSFDPVGLKDTIHHTVEERQHFQDLIALGLTDTFRMFEQPEKSYSWWDYRMLGFQKNRGLRIDHILVSDALKARARADLGADHALDAALAAIGVIRPPKA